MTTSNKDINNKNNNPDTSSSQCNSNDDIRFNFEKSYDPSYVTAPCCLPNASNLSPSQMLSYMSMRRNGKRNMEDDLQAYIDSVQRQFKSFTFFEEKGDLDSNFGQKNNNAQKISTTTNTAKSDPNTESNNNGSSQNLRQSNPSKRSLLNPLFYSRNSQRPIQIQENEELISPREEALPTQKEGRDDFENRSRANMPNQLLSAMKPYFSCHQPDEFHVVAPSPKFMDPYKRLRCSSVGKLACMLNDDGSVFTSNSELEEVYLLERVNSYNTENTLNTSITGNSFMTVETNQNSSSSKEGIVQSQKEEQQYRHCDDNGNVIHPHVLRAEQRRHHHAAQQQQQQPKSALLKNKLQPGVLKVKNGKTYRKKLVKFDYPPVKSLKQIPRTDPKDVEKLFFSSEELDRLENDRLNTNSSEVVELIATSESSESDFSMVKQPAPKTNSSTLNQKTNSTTSLNHPPHYQGGYANNSNRGKPNPYQQGSSSHNMNMDYSNPYQRGYSGDLSWIDCSAAPTYKSNSNQTNHDNRHRSDASHSSSGTKNLYWEEYNMSKKASNSSKNEETPRRKSTPRNHNKYHGQNSSNATKSGNRSNWEDNRSRVAPENANPPQRRNISHITKGIVNHNRRVSSTSSTTPKNNNPVKRFMTIDSGRKKKSTISTNGSHSSTPRSTKE